MVATTKCKLNLFYRNPRTNTFITIFSSFDFHCSILISVMARSKVFLKTISPRSEDQKFGGGNLSFRVLRNCQNEECKKDT